MPKLVWKGTRVPVRKGDPYRAASRIQRAWRKSRKPDKIKSAADVNRAVMKNKPSSVFWQNISSTVSDTPFNYCNISNITFSTNDNTQYARKSSKIRVGHIAVRLRFERPDAPNNLMRLMVVRLSDTEQSPAAFSPANIFEFNDGFGTQPDHLYASPNLTYVDVKYDRIFTLQNTSAAAPGTRNNDAYFNFKIPCHEVWKYPKTASGSAVASRNAKNYYLVALSDSATGTTHPRITGSVAVWFKNISR